MENDSLVVEEGIDGHPCSLIRMYCSVLPSYIDALNIVLIKNLKRPATHLRDNVEPYGVVTDLWLDSIHSTALITVCLLYIAKDSKCSMSRPMPQRRRSVAWMGSLITATEASSHKESAAPKRVKYDGSMKMPSTCASRPTWKWNQFVPGPGGLAGSVYFKGE